MAMNWDSIKGEWKNFRGKVKEQWGKLTDDDLDVIDGKREQLSGTIQKHYGLAREDADRQIDDWVARNRT